jgi:hypothetical protein
MLIPNAKFLVLPLVALAVIASLPSAGNDKSQFKSQPETLATVAPAQSSTGCDQPHRSSCTVAMQPSMTVVR